MIIFVQYTIVKVLLSVGRNHGLSKIYMLVGFKLMDFNFREVFEAIMTEDS